MTLLFMNIHSIHLGRIHYLFELSEKVNISSIHYEIKKKLFNSWKKKYDEFWYAFHIFILSIYKNLRYQHHRGFYGSWNLKLIQISSNLKFKFKFKSSSNTLF